MLVLAAHLLIIPVLVYSYAATDTMQGSVIAVTEGDTLILMANRERIMVHLAGIDAPEPGQPHSVPSRESLSALALGKALRCAEYSKDRFGRAVARCSIDGLDLGEEQVRRGMAWAVERSGNEVATRLHVEARLAKRGLWSEVNPVPPWNWRRL